MLDFIADRADIIIAGVQTALTLDMLPTIWTQFRARASTVPLTSSVPTAVGLAVLGLVFFSTGLPIATATVLVGSIMWTVVAVQRIWYNRHDGSTVPTSNSDAKLCLDDSRLSGSSPVDIRYEGGECGCVHFARSGWCWHYNGAPRGGSRQEGSVGLDGNPTVTTPPVEEVPDLVQHTPATTHDCYGDRIKLEEV